MLDDELHTFVNALSLEFFDTPFQHRVTFNYRLRTTGGRYIPSSNTIELNPKYATEMDKSELIGIIKHELCHYHLHIMGKGYKHGDAEFKKLLKETNSPRHCNPLPSVKDRYKHLYSCSGCGHTYKRIRTININKFRCGKCRGALYKV